MRIETIQAVLADDNSHEVCAVVWEEGRGCRQGLVLSCEDGMVEVAYTYGGSEVLVKASDVLAIRTGKESLWR